jgi:hypothetical protein
MSKLLQGRLPFSVGESVPTSTYNKAVRLLEISLDSFDPDSTPQFTAARRDELQFRAGDIIWNLSEGVLQVYTGNVWQNISSPSTSGLSATGSIGNVSVSTNGSVVVDIT